MSASRKLCHGPLLPPLLPLLLLLLLSYVTSQVVRGRYSQPCSPFISMSFSPWLGDDDDAKQSRHSSAPQAGAGESGLPDTEPASSVSSVPRPLLYYHNALCLPCSSLCVSRAPPLPLFPSLLRERTRSARAHDQVCRHSSKIPLGLSAHDSKFLLGKMKIPEYQRQQE